MKLITFEKKLGLFGAVCVTVGAVIGVGIFVIVGDIGRNAGHWTPLAFGLAALPAIFGTLVAITLGSTIPADGGGYFYTKTLTNKYLGAITSLMVIIGALGSVGAVSVGVAEYVGRYFPLAPKPLVAMGIVLATWGINSAGIMASEKFQILMVVQLVSALLMIIAAAVLGGGNPDFSQPLPAGTSPFLGAAALACLAYTGFNIIGELGDEVKNPRRNIPLIIIFGLGIIILIYVGVGWVVAGTLTIEEMDADVPLLDTAMRHLPGWTAHYINLAALAGAITSINAVFLAVPREFSAMAEDGIFPKWIMKFNPKKQTFTTGMAIVALISCGMMLLNVSDKTRVSEDQWGVVAVAGLLMVNLIISVAVFWLFKKAPEKVESAPLNIKRWWLYPAAVLSALFSIAFVALALLQWWANIALFVFGLVAGPVLVYRAHKKGALSESAPVKDDQDRA